MINLKVKNYCHECVHFEARTIRNVKRSKILQRSSISVVCKYKHLCPKTDLIILLNLFIRGGKIMNSDYQEVDFKKYCKVCSFEDLAEDLNPCAECLEVGSRFGTDKPIGCKTYRGDRRLLKLID